MRPYFTSFCTSESLNGAVARYLVQSHAWEGHTVGRTLVDTPHRVTAIDFPSRLDHPGANLAFGHQVTHLGKIWQVAENVRHWAGNEGGESYDVG